MRPDRSGGHVGSGLRGVAALAVVAPLMLACAAKPPERARRDVVAAPAAVATALAGPSPPARIESPSPPPPQRLDAPAPFADLPVEGFAPAVVSLPLGASSRRPIAVAAHGNYDRPEWQCEVWRGIIGDRAFVLCPRGVARPDSPAPDDVRFMYTTNQVLEREVDAGLEALRARWGSFADDGAILWCGFSQGAIMGAAIMTRTPSRYPRAVLVEGGFNRWTSPNIAKLSRGGGERILFACGQAGCNAEATRAARALERSGLGTRVVYAQGLGHRYDDAVADRIRDAFAWVIEDDSRW